MRRHGKGNEQDGYRHDEAVRNPELRYIDGGGVDEKRAKKIEDGLGDHFVAVFKDVKCSRLRAVTTS